MKKEVSVLGKRRKKQNFLLSSKRQKREHECFDENQHLISKLKQLDTLLSDVNIFDFIDKPQQIFEFIIAVKSGNFL